MHELNHPLNLVVTLAQLFFSTVSQLLLPIINDSGVTVSLTHVLVWRWPTSHTCLFTLHLTPLCTGVDLSNIFRSKSKYWGTGAKRGNNWWKHGRFSPFFNYWRHATGLPIQFTPMPVCFFSYNVIVR